MMLFVWFSGVWPISIDKRYIFDMCSGCFPQDVLEYLSLFQEDTSAQGLAAGADTESVHPALSVIEAFRPETAPTTISKLRTFLEDACKAMGQNFVWEDLQVSLRCHI